MKKTKKIINWLLGAISIAYASILIFPSFLFANNLEYKSFTVYYHSSEINVEKLKLVLDKSENLLINTELYNAGINQDILKLIVAEKENKTKNHRNKYSKWWLAVVDTIGYGLSDLDLNQFNELPKIENQFDRLLLVSAIDHKTFRYLYE